MKYFTGNDYPKLCDRCRATITAIAGICEELPDEYASDEEGPCNFAYDNGLLCNANDSVLTPSKPGPQIQPR